MASKLKVIGYFSIINNNLYMKKNCAEIKNI